MQNIYKLIQNQLQMSFQQLTKSGVLKTESIKYDRFTFRADKLVKVKKEMMKTTNCNKRSGPICKNVFGNSNEESNYL